METPLVDKPQRRKDRWLTLLGLGILVASTDSRVLNQFGYIPRANVIGRITLIYWSLDLSRIGTVPK